MFVISKDEEHFVLHLFFTQKTLQADRAAVVWNYVVK